MENIVCAIWQVPNPPYKNHVCWPRIDIENIPTLIIPLCKKCSEKQQFDISKYLDQNNGN